MPNKWNNYTISKEIQHFNSMKAAAKATSNQSEWQRCCDAIELLEQQLSLTGASRHA